MFVCYGLLVYIFSNDKLMTNWYRDYNCGMFSDQGSLIFCAGFAPFPILNVFVLGWLVYVISKYNPKKEKKNV
jgi:hypothetical protein